MTQPPAPEQPPYVQGGPVSPPGPYPPRRQYTPAAAPTDRSAPVAAVSRRRWWPWIVAAVVVVLALSAGAWAAVRPSLADRAGEACQNEVRARLKAPATAQFSGVTVTDWRGGHFKVIGQVDAQNGFGALVRGPFACELFTPDGGGVWTANSVKVS